MWRPILYISLALALAPSGHLYAYIERLYSLDEILKESTNVVTGKVEEVDRKRRTVVAAVERASKGAKEYDRVQWNIGVGDGDQANFLLALLEKGDPMVLFYERRDQNIQAIVHCGDVWFQLFANHEEDDAKVWWRFTHLEIYLGRTFRGTTPELIRLVDDVLAGRRKPPPPDPSVPKLDVERLDPRAALAQKGRAQGAPASLDRKTVIQKGAGWRYRKGKTEPSTGAHGAWREAAFDDSSWKSGKAPFGYGDAPLGTELGDMKKEAARPGYATLYLRRTFEVQDPRTVRALSCSIDYDDGFILWLNGKKALAVHEPDGEPAHDSLASGNHESGAPEVLPIPDGARLLAAGRNVAAVQVFNHQLTSSDLKLDLELELTVETVPQEEITGVFQPIVELPGASGEVRGISWADVDGNERLDVLFCRGGGNLLLLNEGSRFAGGTERCGLAGGSRSASWADYNGDDHPDLLTSDFRIYTNRGGKLHLEPELVPAPDKRNPEGAGWIDANADGLPDVLITNGEHGILLHENTGSGPRWFRDASADRGLGATGIGKGNGDFIAFADHDGDGFTDFLYNLEGGLLARNDRGKFRSSPKSGVRFPGDPAQKRGAVFGDLDADGDLDLFVPGGGAGRLYRNENDGTFEDASSGAGDLAARSRASFSAAWGDVDHDGSLDLFVCYTDGPGRLYRGDGGGKFRDVTETAGLAGLEPSSAASFADVDDDGDLDLALNLERRVLVLRNGLEKKAGRAPLRVRIHARRGVIGSVIRVTDERSGVEALRELNGAEGCGGQGGPIIHVAVPVGGSTVSAVLSDGRVAQKKVEVPPRGAFVTLEEGDFER